MSKLILFEGTFSALYPEGIKLEGDSAAECLEGLQNYPGFRKQDGIKYNVILPGFGSRDAIYSKTDIEVIRIREIAAGAGGKGGIFVLIIIGVLAIFTGGLALSIGAGLGAATVGGVSASLVVQAGALLVLQGVIALMQPSPKSNSGGNSGDEKSNYLTANAKNSTKIGTRIPLMFGLNKWGGHILSFNISSQWKGTPLAQLDMAGNGAYTVVGSSTDDPTGNSGYRWNDGTDRSNLP